jgi:hypothetical protein
VVDVLQRRFEPVGAPVGAAPGRELKILAAPSRHRIKGLIQVSLSLAGFSVNPRTQKYWRVHNDEYKEGSNPQC